ncbi:MAG: hypothetical protein RL197_209 [Actinomycetota bacterium]|jgi:hypothetical protein
MTSLRILGYSQAAAYLGILAWLLAPPENLYALVSPMIDFTKIIEYLYLGSSVVIYQSVSLYIKAKPLDLEQLKTAKRSQELAFIGCLALLLPAFAAVAYPQLLAACVVGVVSYPISLILISRYQKTLDQDT